MRLDRKDDPNALAKKHITWLRLVCSGAHGRAAARIHNAHLDAALNARLDAERAHTDSKANALGALDEMRKRGLPRPADVEAQARRDAATRTASAWTHINSTDPDSDDEN